MANQRQKQKQRELDMGVTPSWPTTMKTFYPNGMCVGTDNSVWLFMQVGMGSVADAKSRMEAVEVGESLMSAYDELALMASPVRDQRNVSKTTYRLTQLLLVNIPHAFMPPKGHPNAEWLYRHQRSSAVQNRALLFGVKLRDSLTTEGIGLKDATKALVSSVVSGVVPLEFYSKDYKRVRQAMERAGLHVPAPESIRLANSWFNQGDFPDVPTVAHAKHIHFLRTDSALRDFEAQEEKKDCRDWPDIPGSYVVSFASVTQTNLLFDDVSEPASHWLVGIVDDKAMCVSVRAKIEPAQVTRKELASSKKKILADAQEKLKNNKSVRSEEEDALAHIGYLIDNYGKGAGRSSSPTLYETSIVVGFAGVVEDIQTIASTSKASLALMDHRQQAAMTETMLCSGVTANPNLHELPTQAIAHSGIQSLSHIGDEDGALLGFTERDRQPAWLSPTAASTGDDPPIMIVAGQSGSGKALPLSALLPTPTGWTTMGEVAIGDMLLGRDGKAAKVVALSPIEQQPEMYLLSLDYKEQIKATRDHLWTITADWAKLGFDVISYQLGAKHLHTLSMKLAENTGDTDEFPRELNVDGALVWLKDRKIRHPFITAPLLTAALDTTDTEYRSSYGHRIFKLGDVLRGLGMRLSQIVNDSKVVGEDEAVVTTAELQGFSNLLPDGIGAFSIRVTQAIEGSHDPSLPSPRETGFRAAMEAMPLRPRLLRSSIEQRVDILSGLMDATGNITGSGDKASYVLRSSDLDCAESYAELIGSLGVPVDTSMIHERLYEMAFTTELNLFDPDLDIEVPRAARVQVTHRKLMEVVRCQSEPARCVAVDSADASYLCSGFVPTHNTMVLLLLAIQFAMMGSPVVIADPKTDSHHDDTVLAYGGQVLSLDSIANSDSVFDPIFFMGQSERTGGIDEAINLASSLLMSLDLWGAHERGLYEAAIPMALNYGVAKGATCTGRALEMADEARKSGDLVGVPADLWGRIKMVITPDSASMARAIIGMNPTGQALSFSDGISLIKVGRTHLDLPEAGFPPSGLSQKISMALVRMMVYGSVVSVSHRSGVVLLDEGWIFLSAGKSEVIALGRLARHLKVLPIIFTQKITDALDADLEDYLSRGLILPIKNPAEAKLALRAFEVEETPDLIARITASALSGGQNGGHNWNSMRALVDPVTKKVHRGTIGIYIDRARRSVPVEIRLPDGFLDVASTRPEDVAARRAANEKIARSTAERKAREAEEDGLHRPSAPRLGDVLVDD